MRKYIHRDSKTSLDSSSYRAPVREQMRWEHAAHQPVKHTLVLCLKDPDVLDILCMRSSLLDQMNIREIRDQVSTDVAGRISFGVLQSSHSCFISGGVRYYFEPGRKSAHNILNSSNHWSLATMVMFPPLIAINAVHAVRLESRLSSDMICRS